MSNSNDVLNTIKDEIIEYVKSSRSPYTSDISQVIRGAHGIKQAVNKPYVGIYIADDDVFKRKLSGDDIWMVDARIYCYMDPEAIGVYDKLHELKDNIVYFLTNDCSYRSYVDVYKCPPIEGGVITTVNYIEIYFTVKYEYSPI